MTKSKYDKLCEQLKNKVNWTAFTWAIGILLLVMGWLITSSSRIENKIDVMHDNHTEMKEDIRELKTDISWLKEEKNNEKQASITTYKD